MKFRDLEQDLKAAISYSIPDFTADMADKDALAFSNSNTDDDSENDDADGPEAEPPCRASVLKIVEEFSICKEVFIDLLSDTPRYLPLATHPPPQSFLPPSLPHRLTGTGDSEFFTSL